MWGARQAQTGGEVGWGGAPELLQFWPVSLGEHRLTRLFLQKPLSSNTPKQSHPATWGMSHAQSSGSLERKFNQDLVEPKEKGHHRSSQACRQLSLPGMSSGRAPEEPWPLQEPLHGRDVVKLHHQCRLSSTTPTTFSALANALLEVGPPLQSHPPSSQ